MIFKTNVTGILVCWLGCGAIFFTPQSIAGSVPGGFIGRLGFVQGVVNVDGVEAKEGHFLKQGSIVETKDGKCAVLLGDESVLHLDRNTRMDLASYSKGQGEKGQGAESATLDLKFGKTRALIRNSGRTEKNLQIKTKTAVMGVRGTSFIVDAVKPDMPQFVTIEGKVAVTFNPGPGEGSKGQTVELTSGQSVTAPAPASSAGGESGAKGEGKAGGASASASGSAPKVVSLSPESVKEMADAIAPPPVNITTAAELGSFVDSANPFSITLFSPFVDFTNPVVPEVEQTQGVTIPDAYMIDATVTPRRATP